MNRHAFKKMKCKICKKETERKSNVQKYCPPCSYNYHLQKARERSDLKRIKQGVYGTGTFFKKGHKINVGVNRSKSNRYENNKLIIIKKDESEILCLIDEEDIPKLKKHIWWYDGRYINTEIWRGYRKKKKIYLHRYLMNPSGNSVIDHINQNTLDNRKCNLRITTKSINNLNRKISAHKIKDRWQAKIKVNKKQIYLGLFPTKEDAISVKKDYLIERGILLNGSN